jgi:hypothetical protein
MILFFDKNTGTALPLALKKLSPPFQIEYHQQHFKSDDDDDMWLPVVGGRNWTVIGHDRQFHENQSELKAIKQYKLGCFYLWGAEAKKWDKAKLFFKALSQIEIMAATTARPFVYSVKKNGNLKRVKLPK